MNHLLNLCNQREKSTTELNLSKVKKCMASYSFVIISINDNCKIGNKFDMSDMLIVIHFHSNKMCWSMANEQKYIIKSNNNHSSMYNKSVDKIAPGFGIQIMNCKMKSSYNQTIFNEINSFSVCVCLNGHTKCVNAFVQEKWFRFGHRCYKYSKYKKAIIRGPLFELRL